MSKATFAVIAAAGVATGAGVTALIYSSSPSRHQSHPAPTATRAPAAPPAASAVTEAARAPSPALPTRASGAPVDPTGLFQYGFPGPISDTITSPPLTTGFDRRTRNPAWVAEHITRESVAEKGGDRSHSHFYEETAIPAAFRARLSDYYRSGYDRGHQVPAADAKWSQEAMDSTFSLANMCPQVGEGFNRDYWAHFEDFCRRLTQKYPSVRIVTGPLYLPKRDPTDGKWRVSYEVIGNPPNVAVPTHFYKVIFAEDGNGENGKVSLGAFVLPNAKIPNEKRLQDFEVPLEAIERASGLEFAGKLLPSRRGVLCQEIKCDITVREFKKANNRKSLPSS
ncbi:nuclease [Arthroderma sp. PD_2]|nr:nuclease [Arthroderma sp. PD_2]